MRSGPVAVSLALVVAAGCGGLGRDDTSERASNGDGRIAFSAGEHPHEDIYVVNADGSGRERLTSDPGADFDPSWSPDGTRIAYRHQADGGDASAEIYVMDADGSNAVNLTKHPGMDISPAWSPDGSTIVFASDRAGSEMNLWAMDPDGAHPTRLSDVAGEYPAWSPDGSRIAFDHVTYGQTGWDVWVMDADGSDAEPLVESVGDDQGPAWSPDGETIAFASSREAEAHFDHVWTVRPDGSGEKRLTRFYADRPVWSPDGRRLLVQHGSLVLARPDGTAVRELPIRGLGELSLPDWTR